MSANYWRNRWINALVHNGVERSAAEATYAATYSKQSADYSKSPEIQALMALDGGGSKSAQRSGAHAANA